MASVTNLNPSPRATKQRVATAIALAIKKADIRHYFEMRLPKTSSLNGIVRKVKERLPYAIGGRRVIKFVYA